MHHLHFMGHPGSSPLFLGVFVRGTPNPPAEQCQLTGPNHWLSRLDTHQHPSTAPPSHTLYHWSSPPPPTSHRRCPSPILVNRLAAPPPNSTDQSSLTTGLYVPPHYQTLTSRPWGPFYLSFHFLCFILISHHSAHDHAPFICTFTSMGFPSFPLWIPC